MGNNLKNIFIKYGIALASAATIPLPLFAQPSSPTTELPNQSAKGLSVRDASILLQRTNRATDNLLILGIIGSINPAGITKEACGDVEKLQSHMIDLDTYKAAQDIMIKNGFLTAEQASRNLKTQESLLENSQKVKPIVDEACAELKSNLSKSNKEMLGMQPPEMK